MKQINEKLISWASILEPNTLGQAVAASQMPFIHPHLALMPDAHLGKGATVGSVIPTVGAIMPAAVGVDIGCGMIAVRTGYDRSVFIGRDLAKLRVAIEEAIPSSYGRYNGSLTDTAEQRIGILETLAERADFNPAVYAANWRMQLGSLGSGNHFIEVTVDEEKRVWLFLHSGSRGVGNKIATYWTKIAREFCERSFIKLPDRDLAYLVEGTDEFWGYIREMRWAQKFALLNRNEMMDRVIAAFEQWVDNEVAQYEWINCHHNFTEQERHFGKDVWLTRKGAIAAGVDQRGLIPGSMGTASYVVTGLGNRLSFNSSPHGAGRVFSRSKAKEHFTVEQLREAMKGIEWNGADSALDEIPGAYKDIDVVMADSADLVKIEHTLRQVVNIKGL